MDIEEIIINLKILQKLEKNQKLITRGAYLNIEAPSLIPEFIRRWNRQDNRVETLKRINTIVNSAIENLDKNEIFNIKEYLVGSKEGINNLKETYSTCSQTCARLDIILDKINTVL
jgi:predicted transglutaminase-like cysteine proteinase